MNRQGLPGIGLRFIDAAVLQRFALVPVTTPDNHHVAVPNGAMSEACIGRVFSGERVPGVRLHIVDASGVERLFTFSAAPNQHARAIPNGGVSEPRLWCTGEAYRAPRIRRGLIPAAGVDISTLRCSSPDEHHVAAPHGGVSTARTRRAFNGNRHPNPRIACPNGTCLHGRFGRV